MKRVGFFKGLFGFKCPKCRKGDLFVNKNPFSYKGFFDMHDKCSVCEQKFLLETGFYYGAMYVSYGYSIAIGVAVCVTLFTFDMFDPTTFFVILFPLLFLLAPIIFRLSRSSWIRFFVEYNPDGNKEV